MDDPTIQPRGYTCIGCPGCVGCSACAEIVLFLAGLFSITTMPAALN